jgi:Protein of unknown function (DUF3300)
MRVATHQRSDFESHCNSGLGANSSKPRWSRQMLAFLLAIGMLFATMPQNVLAAQDNQNQTAQDQPQDQAPAVGDATPSYTPQSPDQVDQLVAPIALYPDSLVAQILSAATFPAQIVEADRWVQAHPDLKDDALAQAVDQQTWDPSVKALCAFPSVLANMDKNISWTSSLGDAYYNQQQDVTAAIQRMRRKAQSAGNLKSTPQQVVQDDGSDVEIQPAQPDVVYVPAYNPWLVYGYPVTPWPYWYDYPGIWFGGPYLSFGVGFGIGYWGGYGWGWGHWGYDWHNHYAVYNHNRYVSRTNTFYNRNNYYQRGGERGVANNVNRGGERGGEGGGAGRENIGGRGGEENHNAGNHTFNDSRSARGYSEERGQSGDRSGAFGGYGHGGDSRGFSSRGQSSFGGGGFGGGGFHGGGGGGGHHR